MFRFPLAEGVLNQPGWESPRFQRRRHRRKRSAGSDPLQGDRVCDDETENQLEDTEDQEPVVPPQDQKGNGQKGGSEEDFWSLTQDVLIRHHKIPRRHLFVPTKKNCPIPLEYIDVLRTTYTDLDSASERMFEGMWTEAESNPLSAP